MKYLYKALDSIILALFFPALVFLPMFRFIMSVDADMGQGMGILGSLLGGAVDVKQIVSRAIGYDLTKLPEYWSVKNIYETFFSGKGKIDFSKFDASVLPKELVSPMKAAAAFLAIAAIMVVFAVIFALFTSRPLISGSLSLASLISLVVSRAVFSVAANDLVSGKISVVSILEKMKELEKYKSMLSYLNIDIRVLELSSAFGIMIMLTAAAAVISFIFCYLEKNRE